jgi:flavin-binding protein dodecin
MNDDFEVGVDEGRITDYEVELKIHFEYEGS